MTGFALRGGILHMNGTNFNLTLELQVASDGNILGVGISSLDIKGAPSPKSPGFGFQCSSDPTQQNKITIPAA
ncbi:uncharacterized protein L969DRAFT_88418 [Mixia osmundae IAM 14324]|uniref:Uncharacterized protein n=1 Tax=Mixia osmundae (strain CBS 9802 / IAM 14324 / JCM 22182 / KY 12970) TaxID=764103 RepID=G7E6Y5_MIXOS|nr:uncharacterized protein L969DRAFT_88418 [Mixia osmundae IAM 14324]KEI39022.1 hypothetical protein L969DRAFT_88418 [Mixia osmundae IAM 14324]GAA98595.1 hypothetical protein E5Q_05282 [Mixia osmundae IAM 14324]